MNVLIATLAGIVPMLVYALLLYWMDRYEKEPLSLVGGVFLWGVMPAAIFSLITQLIFGFPLTLLDQSGLLAEVVGAIFIAPVTEEFFKGLAVLAVFLLWRNEFDSIFDGIIYGGMVGFGFAAIENVLYFLDADFSLIFARTVLFGLNHAFFTSLTGIGFGIARHARKALVRWLAPLGGLIAAMTAHGLHNAIVTFAAEAPVLCLLAILADWGGVLFVFVVMLLAIRRERQWIVDELREEVALQTLSENQYALVSSPIRRMGARLNALFSGGPQAYWRAGRYFQMLTELAYKKHAYQRRGEAGASLSLIDALRVKTRALSAELADLA